MYYCAAQLKRIKSSEMSRGNHILGFFHFIRELLYMALPEGDLNKAINNLYRFNLLSGHPTTVSIFGGIPTVQYYDTIDTDFLESLSAHLISQGFSYGVHFNIYYDNFHYNFLLGSQACAISFIIFHNNYYPFNPIPVPFDYFPLDFSFTVLSAKKVSYYFNATLPECPVLFSRHVQTDNKFAILQDFSLSCIVH